MDHGTEEPRPRTRLASPMKGSDDGCTFPVRLFTRTKSERRPVERAPEAVRSVLPYEAAAIIVRPHGIGRRVRRSLRRGFLTLSIPIRTIYIVTYR